MVGLQERGIKTIWFAKKNNKKTVQRQNIYFRLKSGCPMCCIFFGFRDDSWNTVSALSANFVLFEDLSESV